jgi:hypothetical protein
MSPFFDDDVVSPELALVDPELAARARTAISVLAFQRGSIAAACAGDDAILMSTWGWCRKRVTATPALTLLAIAAASMIVTSFTGREPAGGKASTTPDVVLEGRRPSAAGASVAKTITGTPLGGDWVVQSSPSSPAATNDSKTVVSHGAPGVRRPLSVSPEMRHLRSRDASAATTTLVWPGSLQASAYDLEIVRDGRVIFATRSRSPQALVPRSWSSDGVSYVLRAQDQAYVWPIVDGGRAPRPLADGEVALDLTLIAPSTG